MPERFLGIQTPHDSGRTGSLPFRPGLHPARPPLSCDHTKTSMASIRAQTDRQRSHREVGWRDAPAAKEEREARARSSQSACRRRSVPRSAPSRVRVCPECVPAGQIGADNRGRVEQGDICSIRASSPNCGRLIGPGGSPPFFASNVRLGGPVPPAVPDAPARRPE